MDGTSALSGETLQGLNMNVGFRVTIDKGLPGYHTRTVRMMKKTSIAVGSGQAAGLDKLGHVPAKHLSTRKGSCPPKNGNPSGAGALVPADHLVPAMPG